jgi:DNA helicase IV
MLPAWVTLVGSLGAALITAIIAPHFTQAAERRTARGQVRERLAEVESLRWEDESYLDFRKAVAALEAAAIIARVPRAAVRSYVKTAEAARQASETYPEGPDGEPITLVSTELADRVQDELERVSQVLWHPVLGRLAQQASLAGRAARRRIGK